VITTIPSIVIILPALVAWFAGVPLLKRLGVVELTTSRFTLLSLFVLYVLEVIHLTVFPIHAHTGVWRDLAQFKQGVNLIPFQHVHETDFVLNIVMMIPIGVFLPIVFRRINSLSMVCLLGLFSGALIETNQYILRITVANDRNVNINDVIANASGVIIGYLVFRFAIRTTTLGRTLRTTLFA
jgi:glycopeptide antibiotics resistance protein